MANEQGGGDLVLPPNTFAFALDSTKGKVSCLVGPHRTSLSNTERLVMWDPEKKKYMLVNDQERAIQVFPVAGEGQYIVLSNPAVTHPGEDSKLHVPSKATSNDAAELLMGQKINIPGPITFPLWPGQTALLIEGHQLRFNQYLLVRVYDEAQAKKNWRAGVVKRQVTAGAPDGGQKPTAEGSGGDTPSAVTSPVSVAPEKKSEPEKQPELTMGQLMLVKGDEVSFYIPPTGIEVVPEIPGKFVREAVTLERLEYCIVRDENGEKTFTQGPAVVFPKPTQKFVESEDSKRKFRAIELNDHSGLYIKVIADYEEGSKKNEAGEELFVTGQEMAIYFPRQEHSIIEYDGRQVHYAIAIPSGEARYVLDRSKGTVTLVRGPRMFLPDPRTQVVVRRILDVRTLDLLYPGNREAQEVNATYQQLSEELSTGEPLASAEVSRASSLMASRRLNADVSEEFAGDTMRRKSAYTPPRTIVLNTKYEGAVAINIWPGYAVLIVKKTGERRVEVGPKMVLLEYDETPMKLQLSTSKPKTDARLVDVAYLRVLNNQVSDIVSVETADLVKVRLELSFRVNFAGSTPAEQEKWFSVENYVKVLTDHCRSRLRNAAKRKGIEEFYGNTIDIVRDTILGSAAEGKNRDGLVFKENGMVIYDVEVLNISIEDPLVAKQLTGVQTAALSGAIELATAKELAERTVKLEELKRGSLDEKQKTTAKEEDLRRQQMEEKQKTTLKEEQLRRELAEEKQKATLNDENLKRQVLEEREKTSVLEAEQSKLALQRTVERNMADAQAKHKLAEENAKTQLAGVEAGAKISDVQLQATRKSEEQKLDIAKKSAEQELARLRGETEEYVKRMDAITTDMIAALQMFGDKLFIEKITEAVGPLALATGVSTVDVFGQIFKGTPFEEIFKSLSARPYKLKDAKESSENAS